MTTLGVRNASHRLPRGQGVEGIVPNVFCPIRISNPFSFDRSGKERAAPYLWTAAVSYPKLGAGTVSYPKL